MSSASQLNFRAAPNSRSYLNHFTQPDSIVPDPYNSQSYDRYAYVLNNPLRYGDPTGHFACEDVGGSCLTENQITRRYTLRLEKFKLASKIHKKFSNVTVQYPNAWYLSDLNEIYYGLFKINGIYGFDGKTDAFAKAFGEVTFVPVLNGSLGTAKDNPAVARANSETGIIRVSPNATSSSIIHEMGHILDGNLQRINSRVPLYSQEFVDKFNLGSCTVSPCESKGGGWIVAPGTTTGHGEISSREDFADSFLAVIQYGSQADQHVSQSRVQIITALIQSYTVPVHSPGR